MRVDVVVLAGGDGAVIDPACRFKGLLPICGRPMIEWVVDALRAAEMVEGVAVVVPTAEDLGRWVDKVDKLVVSNRDFMDNVLAGVQSFRVDRPVLVTTGDLPLLTAGAVDGFVRASASTSADFTYPLIPRVEMERAFPGGERTYVRLASGEATGGNMMLVNPVLVQRNRDIGQRMFDARKSPVTMARLVGFRVMVKFLAGRLEPAEVAGVLERVLGGSAAAIVVEHASIGMDVDKAADVLLAERMLCPQ